VTALSGAVSIALGSVFAFLVNYTQYTDLVGYFEGRYPDFHAIANWFILAGLLLLGLAFLQAGLKAWLAYLLIGTAVVLAVALLIWPGIFFAIPFVEMILLPVIGIVLLRQ
jgi:cytosine/uracil/thiamine/allantoin permease